MAYFDALFRRDGEDNKGLVMVYSRFFNWKQATSMRHILFVIAILAGLTGSGTTAAQVRLPSIRLPAPAIQNLPSVAAPIRNTEINIDASVNIDLRLSRQRELVRKYGDILDLDPAGAPVRRGQLLAIGPSATAMTAIAGAGFRVLGERDLAGLDVKVLILQPPPRLDLVAALVKLREIDPEGTYDYNHIYSDSGSRNGNDTATLAKPRTQTDVPAPPSGDAGTVKIGLIDGGVDHQHPALRDSRLIDWGCDGKNIPSAHGTAVASLMAGRSAKFHGVAPLATLYAANVYCGAPAGGAVDSIVEALAWMARERIAVINLSLVGPPNATLERVLKIIHSRGHIVVAAVGNDGPAAPPLFPAAYPGVVAVTAVDAGQKVLAEACRGPHVAFAAPGSDELAADDKGKLVSVRGTSFAAPIVAAMLAHDLPMPDRDLAARAIARLASQAVDLGAAGRDPIYGYGLVGLAYRNPA